MVKSDSSYLLVGQEACPLDIREAIEVVVDSHGESIGVKTAGVLTYKALRLGKTLQNGGYCRTEDSFQAKAAAALADKNLT